MNPNELSKKIVPSTNIKNDIKILDKDPQKDKDPNQNLSSKNKVDKSEPKQIALSLKILNKEYDFYERVYVDSSSLSENQKIDIRNAVRTDAVRTMRSEIRSEMRAAFTL